MTARRVYPQSCADAHDSSLCGGSLLAHLHAKPPLKGEVPALGGRRGSVPPAPHGRGGSVSRRDHNQATGIRAQLTGARTSEGRTKPIPSYSSGGGPGEGLLLEKPPPPAFPQCRKGRGGSVSRRDHNQATGICAQLAWAHKYAGRAKPIPSHSSGGGPGEALLLEKRPPPEFFPSLAITLITQTQ